MIYVPGRAAQRAVGDLPFGDTDDQCPLSLFIRGEENISPEPRQRRSNPSPFRKKEPLQWSPKHLAQRQVAR